MFTILCLLYVKVYLDKGKSFGMTNIGLPLSYRKYSVENVLIFANLKIPCVLLLDWRFPEIRNSKCSITVYTTSIKGNADQG